MGHGADLIGCILIVYGGIYGEDNKILDDFAAFDIDLKLWIKVKARYYDATKNISNGLSILENSKKQMGPLMYHAMTSILEPGTS